MKTAIVIGATGMVGKSLVDLLIQESHFTSVIVFTRRALQFNHEKLQQHVIDFNKADTWQHLVKGDVLFSALGTTLKDAGSQQAQYKVDYTYQLDFAKAASANGVATYVLVSSASANPDAKIFYTRMKGELERDVQKLDFQYIAILQPSLLVGSRERERMGEKIGYQVLKFLNMLGMFKKYKPIHADIVAKAMNMAALQPGGELKIYTLDNIFDLAGETKDRL